MSSRAVFPTPLRSDSYDAIVPKKGSKSQIWGYFGLPADVDGNILDPGVAVCNTCRREVGCKGGSTSNMRSHIRNHHASLFKQLLAAERGRKATINSVSNLPSTSKKCKKETNFDKSPSDGDWSGDLDSRDEDNYNKALARFLALENVPTGLIDRPHFRNFVHCLNRGYQLPDQQFFSEKAIPDLYHSTLINIRRLLSTPFDHVALTCDSWNLISSQSYLTLTAHFLDPDFELVSICLKCTQFMKDISAVEMVELLQSILDQLGLRLTHVTACTIDDHKTLADAIQCLNLHRVPCFGRSLSCSLERAFKLTEVDRALNRLRKLRCHLVQNVELVRNFDEVESLDGDFQVRKIPVDSPDNWRSTLYMSKYFLDHQLEITNALLRNSVQRHLLPNQRDIQVLEALTEVLKPLEELAGHICGDSNLIASSVVPVYYYTSQLLKIESSESPIKKAIKEAVMEALEVCYGNEHLKNLLEFCTFCDPRYRLQFFKEDNLSRIRDDVHKAVVSLNTAMDVSDHPPAFDISLLWTGNDCGNDSSDIAPFAKQKKGIATLLEKLVTDTGSKSNPGESKSLDERVEEELNRFLQMSALPLDGNPLTWWKTNGGLFPLFQKMAKKYLIVQGSCVPGDNMFGAASPTLNSLRSTLCPNTVEMQVFIAKNKKYIDFAAR